MNIKLSLCAVAVLAGITASVQAAPRPNIILVMTDDQGYGDLSCNGHPFIKTPHIDSLREQSMRFEDFHVSSSCAPTRRELCRGSSVQGRCHAHDFSSRFDGVGQEDHRRGDEGCWLQHRYFRQVASGIPIRISRTTAVSLSRSFTAAGLPERAGSAATGRIKTC